MEEKGEKGKTGLVRGKKTGLVRGTGKVWLSGREGRCKKGHFR